MIASLFLVALFLPCQSANEVMYDGCEASDYYARLPTDKNEWTESILHQLLKSTHRKILPYTSQSRDDVWKALIDLDHGKDSNSSSTTGSYVHLIYKQIDVPAFPHGNSTTWNREHLWPKSRGVSTRGADYTDIHHLRPADWNVNSARNKLLFGECGVARPIADCTTPAHSEAPGTADDGRIFQPPASVQGDIARALFYMAIRYNGQESGTDDLILTDCPNEDDDNVNEMAYKSVLLKWHEEDPVDDAEAARNSRACQRWQGNRNVFVDFPELVAALFGSPLELLGDGLGYECSESNGSALPVLAPVATPAVPPDTSDTTPASGCDSLQAGDIMMVGVSTDNPDYVALVALKDIPAGITLFLTDKAWTGADWRSAEGTLSHQIMSNLPNGTIFGYGEELALGNQWTSVSGSFSLSALGDNVFLYCIGESSGTKPRFLSGLSISGPWLGANLPDSEYGTGSSSLPSSLSKVGSVALEHKDNYHYAGPTEGTVEELIKSISNSTNWEGSNSERYNVSGRFVVKSGSPLTCVAVLAPLLLLLFLTRC